MRERVGQERVERGEIPSGRAAVRGPSREDALQNLPCPMHRGQCSGGGRGTPDRRTRKPRGGGRSCQAGALGELDEPGVLRQTLGPGPAGGPVHRVDQVEGGVAAHILEPGRGHVQKPNTAITSLTGVASRRTMHRYRT